MEVCPTCDQLMVCECQTNMITISKLLYTACNRLSDEEKKEILGENYGKFAFQETTESTEVQLIKGTPLIDKFNFKLEDPMQLRFWKAQLKTYGVSYKTTQLNGESGLFWELQSDEMEEKSFFVKQPYYERQTIDTFITRPSAFESLDSYYSFIMRNLIGNRVIKTPKRLDLAVDYNKSFDVVKEGLDCKLMRVNKNYSEHTSQGGKDTGMYFGQGNKVICVYDHAKKHRSSEDKTRVELRLKNTELGLLQSIEQFPEFIKNYIHSNHPLKQIELNQITFYPEDNFPDRKQKKRYIELKTLIQNNGLYQARKKLEKQTTRNFSKLYKPFYNLEKSYEQPTDALLNWDIKIPRFIRKSLDASMAEPLSISDGAIELIRVNLVCDKNIDIKKLEQKISKFDNLLEGLESNPFQKEIDKSNPMTHLLNKIVKELKDNNQRNTLG